MASAIHRMDRHQRRCQREARTGFMAGSVLFDSRRKSDRRKAYWVDRCQDTSGEVARAFILRLGHFEVKSSQASPRLRRLPSCPMRRMLRGIELERRDQIGPWRLLAHRALGIGSSRSLRDAEFQEWEIVPRAIAAQIVPDHRQPSPKAHESRGRGCHKDRVPLLSTGELFHREFLPPSRPRRLRRVGTRDRHLAIFVGRSAARLRPIGRFSLKGVLSTRSGALSRPCPLRDLDKAVGAQDDPASSAINLVASQTGRSSPERRKTKSCCHPRGRLPELHLPKHTTECRRSEGQTLIAEHRVRKQQRADECAPEQHSAPAWFPDVCEDRFHVIQVIPVACASG